MHASQKSGAQIFAFWGILPILQIHGEEIHFILL
jgi:hypothetical protein